MKISIKPFERLISDNAPVLLTGVAIAGTLTTGYLAAQGAFKASAKFKETEIQRYRLSDDVPEATVYLTREEKLKAGWMYFLPAAGSAALTITCIVCAHKVTMGRAAAMAAAYSLTENKFSEYKAKVEERFGLKDKEEVDEAFNKQRMESAKPSTVVFMGRENDMCFDSYSGRYFKSSQDEINSAVIATNLEMMREKFTTLETFWNEIGLDPTAYSDELGFTVDCPLEPRFSYGSDNNGRPCLILDYEVVPVRRYNHLG